MISTHLSKALRVAVVALAACGCAFAQYGGGTGGTGGTGGGTYTPGSKSYGNGAAIGAGVGAAAGAGILFLVLHNRHAPVVGCVASDGKTLTADKGKHTYQLTGEPVTAGEHVSVVGKKSKGGTGIDELNVASVKKDLGQCQQQTAMAEPHP
ncbi:MAG: hypothetical protein WB952_06070 [Terriglobales bacterium]